MTFKPTMKIFLLVLFITAQISTLKGNPLKLECQKRLEGIRVIVIGAGVAGVTAAAKLASSGNYNVTLLEADDHIGGRTHTIKFGDLSANHIEMGGEWVHGEVGNSVFELVSPLGLLKETGPKEFGNQFGLPNGEILSVEMSDGIRELLNYMWRDPEGWDEEFEEDYSMGIYARMIMDLFNEKYPITSNTTLLEAIYDWAHRVTNAEDASDNWFEKSNTDNGEQYEELEGFANIPWKAPFSYLSLLQLLLTGTASADGNLVLPDWIQLNKQVISINASTTDETVEVCTSDGSCSTADHVIFTPSIGVLKAHHATLFNPPLPAKKQLAIENIGFGSATKLFYEFETPWWPPNYEGTFLLWDDIDYNYNDLSWTYWRSNITKSELMEYYNGFPLWTRSILNVFTVDSGSAPNMIRIWVTGFPSRFLDEFHPDYIQSHVMRLIHKYLDAQFPNITEPIRSYQSKWSSNPFTRGVYSYRTLDSEELDVWARDIAEPILVRNNSKPIICFAGEATHPTFFSTVHGAHDTGNREFDRIEAWYATQHDSDDKDCN